MNAISSIVVKCAPKYKEEVIRLLSESALCEIYAHDEKGRIVVVTEGKDTQEESEKLTAIQAIPHILSAEVVYAYSETEFSECEDKFEKLLETVNEDVLAQFIKYNGHI